MPIPLIVWAAAAGGSAYLAWKNRKQIAAFFESEAGQELIRDLGKAAEGAMAPYRNMLDQCLVKDTDERRIYLREAKKRMSDISWNMLVEYGKGLPRQEPKYFAAVMDLMHVDAEG